MKHISVIICSSILLSCTHHIELPEHHEVVAYGVEQRGTNYYICDTCLTPTVKYLDVNEVAQQTKSARLDSVASRSVVDSSITSKLASKSAHSIKLRPVYFELDSYALSQASKSYLRTLHFSSGTTVHVTGYTDAYGSQAYNKKLAERRAFAVVKILKQQNPDAKFHVMGKGSCCYVTSSPFDALNRRVEIKVN